MTASSRARICPLDVNERRRTRRHGGHRHTVRGDDLAANERVPRIGHHESSWRVGDNMSEDAKFALGY
jgi:hypothetical protein